MWLWLKSWFTGPEIKPIIVVPHTDTIPSTTPNIPSCGLDLIKQFESCKLKAYQDQGRIWTIGFGHTAGVREQDSCTQEQADVWLQSDCLDVLAALQRLVTVPLTANQRGALLSWTFNLGVGALEKSSLLALINASEFGAVPAKIRQFIYVTLPNGNRIISQGLVRRRKAEALLWVGGDWRVA